MSASGASGAPALAALCCAGDALARPHDNCYWLAEGRVLAGEHPGLGGAALVSQRLQALADAGVGLLVDLSAAGDAVAAYAPSLGQVPGLERAWFPITDFGVPTVAGMRATLDAIHAALESGRQVYLHCKAGVGRTGTVAACYLVDCGLSPEEALRQLERKWQVVAKRDSCPVTPETDAQRAFIAAWKGRVTSAPSGSRHPGG